MYDRRKVLIIDDEIDLCLLLKSYFLKKDYDVYVSHTLEQGISYIKTIQPGIVFLDNNLPDGIGWTMAPELSKDFPYLQIILISAFHPLVPEMQAESHFQVIEKPISFADLDKRFEDIGLSI